MEKGKRLTLDALIAKKEQRESQKIEFYAVEIPSLDGCLQLEKIPLTRVASLMDGAGGESMADNLAFDIDLIYACCPMMRNKDLQTAYGVTDPTDIVCALLDDNMSDINLIVTAILGMYGLDDTGALKDAVKN